MMPWVWIEDPNYAYGAFLILRGQIPYQEFAAPNLPLLEQILAGFYHVLGPDYRVAEFLSAMAALGSSVCLGLFARRWFGPVAGWAAAAAFAWHPLVFRYHLFEREVFVALALAWMWLILPWRSRLTWRRGVGLAVLAACGFGVKQTLVFSVAGPLIILSLLPPRRRDGWMTSVLCAAGMVAIYGLYGLIYGRELFLQTFIFHFIKGNLAPLDQRLGWLVQATGPLLFMGCIGMMFAARHDKRIAAGAAAAFGMELLFSTIISDTFWPHYLITALIPAAVGWGALVQSLASGLKWQRGGPFLAIAGTLLMIAACGIPPFTVGNVPWLEWTGLGGDARAEVEALGNLISANSQTHEVIIAPPFTALVSARVKIVNFEDNWGVMLALREAMATRGLGELRAQARRGDFAQIRATSRKYWIGEVAAGIKSRRFPVVVTNYELPADPKFIEASGYRLEMVWKDQTVWIRDP